MSGTHEKTSHSTKCVEMFGETQHTCMCMYQRVTTYIYKRHVTHIQMSQVSHMDEARHTYEWVLSHNGMCHATHTNKSHDIYEWVMSHTCTPRMFLDGYCSTVQGLLDWFEVDLGCTELLFSQIGLCVMCVFVLYSPVSLSSCPFFGHPALPPPRGGSASRVSASRV